MARTRPPEVLREIVRLHRAMNEAARANDAAGYYRLNDDFHRAIVLGADNATLADMHEHIMWHVHRARHRANRYEGIEEDAATHHDEIVREIVAGNAEGAARAIATHLEEVSETIVGHIAD